MKKIIISFLVLVVIIIITIFTINKAPTNKLTKVKVAEVTHSVFYAPQYAALALGYFEDEGLDVELNLVPGADKVTAAVLSGDVNIGFCGSEATIYVYNGGQKDYLVTFAGLTKKDGSFIVSREKYKNFKITDLIGKKVIGGRKGGMPELTFEWALREANIDPKNDLTIDTSIEFSAMSGAFIGGNGDFVTLFEPAALQMEKQGYGYVVSSVGLLGGTVPYTAYNAKKSYIEKNPRVIEGYSKAINKGLTYVHSHTPKEIAMTILDYFPDTTINDLEAIVKRYKDNDSWYKNTYISEKDFNHLQTIISSSLKDNKKAPYNKLVNTEFMKK